MKWANKGLLKPAMRTPGGDRRWTQESVDAFKAAMTAAAD